jgi:uncharacterized membrane protein (UPF0127 family)
MNFVIYDKNMTVSETIDDILGTALKTGLAFFVFVVSFNIVPALQAWWEESGVTRISTQEFGSNLHTQKFAVIGDATLKLEISDTPSKREKGLSGRESIDSNTAMIFIFNKADYHGIWMKDMNFPIDIIWISETMQVVHVEEYVYPDTYPEIFKPSQKAKYILEVDAGFADKEGIKITDLVTLL